METVIFVPGSDRPYPAEQYSLRATNIGWSKNHFGMRNVIGTVVNSSPHDLDWVRVEFTLVNREGIPVGSTSDCLIDFKANDVWHFQAPVSQLDASGVGAPQLSCEFGKLVVPRPAPAPRPAVQQVQRLIIEPTEKASGTSQWVGLRITGLVSK